MMRHVLISPHAQLSVMPSVKMHHHLFERIGFTLSTLCSSSIVSKTKRTAQLLANALAIATLPPASPAYGLSLPTLELPASIRAIEASAFSTPTKYCKKDCKTNENGYAIIRTFEGYSPFVYICPAGYPTIGYGHLIKTGEKFKTPLLPKDAQRLLEGDVRVSESAVNRLVQVKLHTNQFSSLVSFTFNLGSGALGSSTLLKRVNAENHADVPNQFNRWIYAGKVKLNGLVTRRFAEGELYAKVD